MNNERVRIVHVDDGFDFISCGYESVLSHNNMSKKNYTNWFYDNVSDMLFNSPARNAQEELLKKIFNRAKGAGGISIGYRTENDLVACNEIKRFLDLQLEDIIK